MRKIFIVLCFLILSLSLLCAEDYEEPITLRTEINGVSGYPDFGFGLFPVATSFQYFRSDLNIFDGAQFNSKIYFYLTYGFSSVNDSGREWDTGRPSWNMTKWEQNSETGTFDYIGQNDVELTLETNLPSATSTTADADAQTQVFILNNSNGG